MMPQSAAAVDVAAAPAAIQIKNALDNIETARKKKEDIMSEVVQDLSNLNMVDSLMAVHSGSASKEEVFKTEKDRYMEFFNRV